MDSQTKGESFANESAYMLIMNDYHALTHVRSLANGVGHVDGKKLKSLFTLSIADGEETTAHVSITNRELVLDCWASGELDWQKLADELTEDLRAEIDAASKMSDVDLLAECRVDDLVVRFPYELDRDTYMRVDNALKKLGGTWSKKNRGHIFKTDPTVLINDAIAAGKVKKVDDFDFFPTPVALARRMVELAELQPGQHVFEPSAGEGVIAEAIISKCPEVTLKVGELDDYRRSVLTGKKYELVCQDFTTYRDDEIYDRIVMNPPFSNKADIRHIRHAWTMLKPGGKLVSVMSGGVTYNSHRETAEFRAFVDKYGYFIELNDGTFKESGTAVKTVLVVLDKPASLSVPSQDNSAFGLFMGKAHNTSPTMDLFA